MIENPLTPERRDNLIKPTAWEVAVLLVISVAMLLLYNSQRIWLLFSNGYTLNETDRLELSETSFRPLVELGSHPIVGTIIVLIFWLFVGSLAYMAIWLTQNSLSEIKQEVDASRFIQPEKIRSNPLKSLLAHYISFIAFVCITLFLLGFGILYVLPVTGKQFFLAVANLWPFDLQLIALLVASIVGLALTLYVISTLLRTITRFWQIYLKPRS